MNIKRSALVAYSAAQMYQLVADVDSYPSFLPGCLNAGIRSQRDNVVSAFLTLGKAGIETTLVTSNVMHENRSIDMSLEEGSFSSLAGHWKFTPLGETGCKIEFELDFEINNPLLRVSIGPIITTMMESLVDAFIQRAAQVYKG